MLTVKPCLLLPIINTTELNYITHKAPLSSRDKCSLQNPCKVDQETPLFFLSQHGPEGEEGRCAIFHELFYNISIIIKSLILIFIGVIIETVMDVNVTVWGHLDSRNAAYSHEMPHCWNVHCTEAHVSIASL